jgi:polysaccharide biosynthesis transport protein
MRLSLPGSSGFSAGTDPTAASPAARGNRRRLRVFLLVFLPCLVAGMAWNLLRPAEYRAVARVQLSLPTPSAVLPAASAPAGDGAADFVSQLQRLRSRPLLEVVQTRLAAAGHTVDPAGGDPVAALQDMLSVTPVEGSTVVELASEGDRPALLAALLNELVAAYGAQLQVAHDDGSAQRLASARDELTRLEQATAERRARLERFRAEAGLSSGEREENPSAARSRGLVNALNTAIEKRAAAEAQLHALQGGAGSASAGRGGATARDDPTLANLESRASQLREELKEAGKIYTDQYLAMDPKARAMRTRLTELEAQIAERRVVGRQLALDKAQEDLAAATANVAQLQARMASEQQGLRQFSARFAQSKAMEQDLAAIERARREAMERLARIEAAEQALRPSVEVLQPATPPESPWQPDYWRDGALVAAGSFALGLLAIGFVELFNRAPQAAATTPVTVVLSPNGPPAWPPLAPAGSATGADSTLAWAPPAHGALPSASAADGVPGQALPAPSQQELSQPQAAALLAAARGPARLACAAWLLGLTTGELTALRLGDVDRAAPALRVGGAWARQVALPGWFVDELPSDPGAAGDVAGDVSDDAAAELPLLQDADGRALGEADLQMLLACAAVDAGLDDAIQLTPERLRYTAMAWWVRSGLRFAELPGRFGRIERAEVSALAALAAPADAAPQRAAGEVGHLMPALRLPPAG